MLVYDNFFPEDLAEKVLAPAHKLPFKGGWKSNSKLDEDPGHWNYLVIGSGKEPRERNFDCQQDPSFVASDCYPLWEVIMKKLGPRRLRRAYFNGYTFGTDGYYHQDAYTLNDDKEYSSTCLQESILCYCNTEWFPNWGGETAFLKDGEIGYSILPKFNRVVVFDGTIWHCARSLSRSFHGLRTILVFKTSREVFDEEDVIRKLSDIVQGIQHSQSYFINHLLGTYNILKQSGFPQATCLAGLFHSIYGTEVFEGGVNISREEVRELIGDVSEELVHLFCTLRPRKQHILQNHEGLLSSWQQYHLAAIELANLMEQKERIRWSMARDQYVAQLNLIIGL